VRNCVTHAYTVEHADEEALLGGLSPLLAAALACSSSSSSSPADPASSCDPAARRAALRALSCQVEAVHTTLRKHLAKEQAMLLPMLRSHFTRQEQARLVAQFVYCIPCATVERVLAWLRPRVPERELQALVGHLREAVPDRALLQLVEGWLLQGSSRDGRAAAAEAAGRGGDAAATPPSSPAAKRRRRQARQAQEEDREPPDSPPQLLNNRAPSQQPQAASAAPPPLPLPLPLPLPAAAAALAAPSSSSSWPPLRTIALFHEGIRGALEAFAAEAEALLAASSSDHDISANAAANANAANAANANAAAPPPPPTMDAAQQLAALVDRHRFLRAVCSFHTSSEEEVVLPEVLRLAAAAPDPSSSAAAAAAAHGRDPAAAADALAAVRAACAACQQEHADEVALFDELGRLLSDARALSRRGRRREARELLAALSASARRVCAAIAGHMAREEADVLPVLEARLGPAGQRALVWGTLRAMPLRLLERVAPWLAAKHLPPEDARGVIETLRLGAPEADARLVELLVRWAERGRGGEEQASEAQAQAGAGMMGVVVGGHGASAAAAAAAVHAAAAAATCDLVLLPAARRPSFTDAFAAGGGSGGSGTGDGDDPATAAAAAAAAALGVPPSSAAPTRPASIAAGRVGSPSAGAGAASLSAPKRRRSRTAGGGRSSPLSGEEDAAAAAAAALAAAAAAATVAGTTAATAPPPDADGASLPLPAAPATPSDGFNPIDHIFQFHRALRQELAQLEEDAGALEAAALAWTTASASAAAAAASLPASPIPPASAGGGNSAAPASTSNARGRAAVHAALTRLHGRFAFLQGIYRAHSRAEDEIVFPALERKHALRNVSHAYTLDHQEEATLLDGIASVVDRLQRALPQGAAAAAAAGQPAAAAAALSPADASAAARQRSAEMHGLCLQLRRQCAAVRASLETHVRAEEAELWPLFAEHFSREEQQDLVGCIIGRTGAEVLQSMLPWVAGVVSTEERAAMMGSLRDATRHTAFERWLGAAVANVDEGGAGGGGEPAAAPPPQPQTQQLSAWDEQVQALMEVAEYLGSRSAGQAAGDAAAGGGGAGGDGGGDDKAAAAADPAPNAAAAAAATTPASVLPSPRRAAPLPLPPSSAPPPPSHHHHHPDLLPDGPDPTRDPTRYAPGWADIFELNQQQLEAAVRRLSADPALDASRRAYLVQHLMAARYVVAQQRRMAALQKQQREEEEEQQQAAAAAKAQQAATTTTTTTLPPLSREGQEGAAAAAAGAAAPARRCAPTKPLPPHVGYHDVRLGVLGCQHYARAAKLVAPCCNRAFTCRLCHDEAVGPGAPPSAAAAAPPPLPPPAAAAAAGPSSSTNPNNPPPAAATTTPGTTAPNCGRRLDRYSVREMLCMLCGLRQPVGSDCRGCGQRLARYYCGICHLFEDGHAEERPVYHCPFCNVCRRGRGLGVDVFHCMRCNACMSLSVAETHRCRERAMEGDCPVCGDALFDSAAPVKELPCAHLLHSACFAQHTRHSYQCPVCLRSAGDMTAYWRMLDSLLEADRLVALPPEYRGRVQGVRCRDCGKDGEAPWHYVYHACPHCRSYNTRVL
jgi:zinc finger protein-like protein